MVSVEALNVGITFQKALFLVLKKNDTMPQLDFRNGDSMHRGMFKSQDHKNKEILG